MESKEIVELPEPRQEPGISESNFDIAEFLPTSEDWLSFLRCLAEDNVDNLKVLSKDFNWEQFLRCRNLSSDLSNCSSDYTSTVSTCNNQHPFPSNPFMVAMFYNAKNCLLYMKESKVDFSSISEMGFNAYHNLMGAIQFNLMRQFSEAAESQVLELISLFHLSLFTRAQQVQMMHQTCCFGMAPLSWGVYLGLANFVECIMYYYSPDFVVTEAVGLAEHITIDVSEFVGENQSYFTSPLSVLIDLYGESTLPELKRLGIFRKGFIWKKWVDLLYYSNINLIYLLLLLSTLLTVSAVYFIGPSVNHFLKLRCAGSRDYFPTGIVAVLVAWLLFSAVGLLFVTIGLVRKEYYRMNVNYPRWPRQYYRDLMAWYLPNIVGFPICLFLLWLYLDAGHTCSLFNRFIYTISGLCNITLLLSCACLIVCYLRFVAPLSSLMSSFYSSLSAFSAFIIFFLVLTGIFARMFQSSFAYSGSSLTTGSTNATARPDSIPSFFSAFYMTFLVSQNIADTAVFAPQDDRIDLIVTHIFFVLYVPILFLNFVIGILTSVVTRVLKHDVENRYILMLSAVDFSERTLGMVRKLFKPRKLVLRICEPLNSQSKLIKLKLPSV